MALGKQKRVPNLICSRPGCRPRESVAIQAKLGAGKIVVGLRSRPAAETPVGTDCFAPLAVGPNRAESGCSVQGSRVVGVGLRSVASGRG